MNNLTDSNHFHLEDSFINVCLLFYGIILVVGIIGNALTFAVVVLNKSMRRSIHFYTINLSLADGLLLLIYVPTQTKMTYDDLYWHMGKTMCSFCNFTISLCLSASVGTLIAISADRMRAVTNPFSWKAHSQHLSKIIIPIIWIASAAIAFPVAYVANLKPEDNSTMLFNCVEEWPVSAGKLGMGYWITIMIIQYILPLAFMAFINGVILYKIKQSGNSINTLHKRMLRMIILLLITYAVCTGMQHMVYFATIMNNKQYPYLFVSSNLVVSLQAAINPLIYGTNRNDFEQAIIGIFKYCGTRISNFFTHKRKTISFSEYQNSVSETSSVYLLPLLMSKNFDIKREAQNSKYLQVPGRDSELDELKRLVKDEKRRDTMAFINDIDQLAPLKSKKVKIKTTNYIKKNYKRSLSGKNKLTPLIVITEHSTNIQSLSAFNNNELTHAAKGVVAEQTVKNIAEHVEITNKDTAVNQFNIFDQETFSNELQIKSTFDEIERIQKEIESTIELLEKSSKGHETIMNEGYAACTHENATKTSPSDMSKTCKSKNANNHDFCSEKCSRKKSNLNCIDSGYWTFTKSHESRIINEVNDKKSFTQTTQAQQTPSFQSFELNANLLKNLSYDSKESYI
ncbi:neuropeptide Y receptor type 1-like [Hydra vulgaris]|uniref:neuropeptide Y receptor type 1-like n=1 Tax=Hydra vulgaris TaxID=6087 RepID=UPI001F5F6F44|nr:neuropeptide Y receptor type 1-like [Hydra vulgaris]XP_047123114.1 neuropeptide Y receptor type 1-like [Hydra vulgaris]